ncbi:hypothetical protein [Legionella brunensis]|uniref:Uncharacterized protein n=1 Tax=Legionella brunensis TaxID=29422 RepID=A0A0W0S470_9GAMM|nr:hypothetical protein [Legionella brunensis]KTC78367.1 hypothetical protein Lbru_2659 [Legionella brunensis]
MFYENYLRYKFLRHSRGKKLEQEKKTQNAPVTIRDLVIYPEKAKYSYGESKSHENKYPEFDTLPRLIDHIKSLARITNSYHQQLYCESTNEGSYQLKKEHLNTITRVSLNEFSLYGDKPLTMTEFGLLVEAIEQIANSLHENVHLLLSSFSVVNNKGELLNVALYVQGGKQAKIDTISKGIASTIDITYKDASNFSQQRTGRLTSHVSSFVAGGVDDDISVSNNSVLEIETKGGARYIQAVDICLDNFNRHSKRLLVGRLESADETSSSFLPEQTDQILTSNSIDPYEEAKISNSVLHVDPWLGTVFYNWNTSRPLDKTLKLEEKHVASINKYPDMNIRSVKGGLAVDNPPFGSNYRLKIFKERQLGGYEPALASKVKVINEKIMSKRLDEMMTSRRNPDDIDKYHYIANINSRAVDSAKELLKQLSQHCKCNLFEFIFGTKSYYLKKEAQSILESANTLLGQLNSDTNDFLISSSPWAHDMKLKLEMVDDGFPHHFIHQMTSCIDTFTNTIKVEYSLDIPPIIN